MKLKKAMFKKSIKAILKALQGDIESQIKRDIPDKKLAPPPPPSRKGNK